jgi:hypothetical protein
VLCAVCRPAQSMHKPVQANNGVGQSRSQTRRAVCEIAIRHCPLPIPPDMSTELPCRHHPSSLLYMIYARLRYNHTTSWDIQAFRFSPSTDRQRCLLFLDRQGVAIILERGMQHRQVKRRKKHVKLARGKPYLPHHEIVLLN